MNKNEPYKRIIVFLAGLILWSLMLVVWYYEWMKNYANVILRPFGYKGNWLVVAVYGILLFFFTHIYNGYKIGKYRPSDVIFSASFAMVIANAVTYLQTCLIGREIMTPWPFVQMTLIHFVMITAWGMISCRIYLKIFPAHRMLLIYGGSELTNHLISKMINRNEKYHIEQAISADAEFDELTNAIDKYSSVILCDMKSNERNAVLKYCYDRNIRMYITPKIADILLRGAGDVNVFDTPLLLIKGYGLSFEQRFAKRTMDIVLSAIGIVITSPFMLLTAIAIKLQDGGPVLFKQDRLTINDKVFSIYKFRSMIVDAEKNTGAVLAKEGDSRITKVGKIMRMIRLDELPQLFNILKGDMSVVGPRPERPELVEEHLKTMEEFSFRTKVKAGLTGYAQVVGRYNTTAYDKLKLDLMYITKYSLLEDIKLILMTVKILFVKESTEGV